MKKIPLFLSICAISYYHALNACEEQLKHARTTAELKAITDELFKSPSLILEPTLLIRAQSRAELLSLLESDTPLVLTDWIMAIDELIKQISSSTSLDMLHTVYARKEQLHARLIPASETMEEMDTAFYHDAIERRQQQFAHAYAQQTRALLDKQEPLNQESVALQPQEPASKRSRSTTPEVPTRTPLSQAQLAVLCLQQTKKT